MTILIVTSFVFVVLYILLLWRIRAIIGFANFKMNYLYKPQKALSIVVPIKNEANNIANLIESFAAQDFPQKLFEIIFVDDNSSDNFLEEINNAKQKNRGLKLTVLKNLGQGKKQAINTAMNVAQTNYVVLTDADVTHSKFWLSNISAYCETHHPKLLVGAVFMNSSSFFEDFQACDYAGMQIIGSSLMLSKHPVLCSGANLIVNRKSFLEVNPYESNIEIASGDDMFLMQSFIKRFGKNSIHFLNSTNSFAFTNAKENLFGYMEQRIRWASKTKYYLNSSTALLGFFVFCIHFFMFLLLALSPMYLQLLWCFCFLLAGKTFMEYLVFYAAEKKFEQKFPLKWFIIFQIVQVVFIPILASISLFKKNTNWKA